MSCNGKGGIQTSYGWNDCVSCNGTGHCSKCHGNGTVECKYCHGTGFIKCTSCDGTGNCSKCDGSGQLTCKRCRGTGCYQTYIEYTAHYCVRQFCNGGPTPEFLDGLRLASGEELCNIVAKYWKKDNVVQFDNTENAFNKIIAKSGGYSEYAKKLKTNCLTSPAWQQNICGYKPYMNILRANKIPYTKIRYSINDEEYEMIFLGNNGIVCYTDVPNTIKLFETTPEEKAFLNRTKYKRHQALAALSAYLINILCNDASMNFRELNLILKHMGLGAEARYMKIKYLMYRYTNEIDNEIMLDNIKCLLTSKKTICYVWYFISREKKPSQKVLNFYNSLTKRYSISESESSTLKRFAIKMANLDDEHLVKEYLDCDAVYKNTHYWSWLIISGIICVPSGLTAVIAFIKMGWGEVDNYKESDLLATTFIVSGLIFIAAFFISRRTQPEYIQSPKSIYNKVKYEEDLTDEDYEKEPFFLKVYHTIAFALIKLAAKIGLQKDIILSNNKSSKSN